MAENDPRRESVRVGERGVSEDDWVAFARNAHIFAAVVREVLECRLLHQLSGDGLTPLQFQLLRFISIHEDQQIADVAEFLGVSSPAATRNVDKLERLGLIERRDHATDRRVTLLAPSHIGRSLIQSREVIEQQRIAHALEGFTPEERAVLARLMERFFLRLLRTVEDRNESCLRCSAWFADDCPVQFISPGCPYVTAGASRRRRVKDGAMKGSNAILANTSGH